VHLHFESILEKCPQHREQLFRWTALGPRRANILLCFGGDVEPVRLEPIGPANDLTGHQEGLESVGDPNQVSKWDTDRCESTAGLKTDSLRFSGFVEPDETISTIRMVWPC
jgi:hypothetical protein